MPKSLPERKTGMSWSLNRLDAMGTIPRDDIGELALILHAAKDKTRSASIHRLRDMLDRVYVGNPGVYPPKKAIGKVEIGEVEIVNE